MQLFTSVMATFRIVSLCRWGFPLNIWFPCFHCPSAWDWNPLSFHHNLMARILVGTCSGRHSPALTEFHDWGRPEVDFGEEMACESLELPAGSLQLPSGLALIPKSVSQGIKLTDHCLQWPENSGSSLKASVTKASKLLCLHDKIKYYRAIINIVHITWFHLKAITLDKFMKGKHLRNINPGSCHQRGTQDDMLGFLSIYF